MEAFYSLDLGDWRVVSTLSVMAITCLYFYLTSTFDYWEKRGFPELPTRPLPLFGHTFKMLIGQRNFADTFNDLYIAAGERKYVGIFIGTRPCLLVKDFETVRQIFIKDYHAFMDRAFEIEEEVDPLNAKGLSNLKGQRWKDMRARLSPTFTSGCIKTMLPLMLPCSEQLLACLTKEIDTHGGKATVEMKEVLMCLTTDVIATCAFGVQCDALQNPETSKFRKMGKLTFQINFKRSIVLALLLISPRLLKWLGLKFSDDESSNFFRHFVGRMVEQREKAIEEENDDGGEGTKRFRDFLYHLVLLKKRGLRHGVRQDDDEEGGREMLEDANGNSGVSWTNVTIDDLTAQAMQFFSAGFETTASTLCFALFELSSGKGKEIQAKLREEIDSVMKEDGGEITYDGLKRMHLLDRVLSETLRKYPPAGLLNRLALQPYTLPGTRLTIDKGAQVIISVQGMHYDEKYFPNPNHFDPDRFLLRNKQGLDQLAYAPFGIGPRACIGQRFALMEARMALAGLVSKFEFELCPEKTRVPLKFKKRAFLLAVEDGIWLNVKHRRK